jgi:hypothetical protein
MSLLSTLTMTGHSSSGDTIVAKDGTVNLVAGNQYNSSNTTNVYYPSGQLNPLSDQSTDLL